jgi:hypothetical protein
MTSKYAAHQHVTRCFFEEAENVLRQARAADDQGKSISGKMAVMIVLAMAAVESFLNAFFLIVAREKKDEAFFSEVEA